MSLFVGNLYISILKRNLNEVFGQFGKCKIDLKKKYAFIDYNEYSQAEKAIKQLNGTTLTNAIQSGAIKPTPHLPIEKETMPMCDIRRQSKVTFALIAMKKVTMLKIVITRMFFLRSTSSSYRRKIQCFKCKSEGHIAKDCPFIRDQSDDESASKLLNNNNNNLSSSGMQGGSNTGASRQLLSPPGLACQQSYSSKSGPSNPSKGGGGGTDYKFDVSSMLSSLNKGGGRNQFSEMIPSSNMEERKKGGIPLYKAHTFHDDKYYDSKILKQATEKLGQIHQNPSLITVQENLQPHQLIQYQVPSNQPRFVSEKMENIDQISNLSISQLKKRLRGYGQPITGSKYMLIDRVKDFLSTQIK